MITARSLAQQKFDAEREQKFAAECERVRAKRDRETALAVAIDFLAVASTAFVAMDIVQMVGFPIAAVFALSIPALVFFGIMGATLLCGIICAIYLTREGLARREAEIALMTAQQDLEKEKVFRLGELKTLLEAFVKETNEEKAKILCARLSNENDIDEAIKEINSYFEEKQSKRLASMHLPINSPVPQKRVLPSAPSPHYLLGTIISFCSGVGFVLGFSASIIGVSALATMMLTPPGLMVLGVVALLAIGVGALMAYSDYRSKQEQELKMEALDEKNKLTLDSCHLLEKTMIRLQCEMVVVASRDVSVAVAPSQLRVSRDQLEQRDSDAVLERSLSSAVVPFLDSTPESISISRVSPGQ